MSTPPDIGQALTNAITGIISALAGVIQGVASALSEHANLIGTVLVLGGVAYLIWRQMRRATPYIGGLLGGLF